MFAAFAVRIAELKQINPNILDNVTVFKAFSYLIENDTQTVSANVIKTLELKLLIFVVSRKDEKIH